jgi:hypothetical protein
VNECNLFWKKKKNAPTYRPIGEMEGRVRETNIFLRVALYLNKPSPTLKNLEGLN